MTTAELHPWIGRTGTIRHHGLTIHVRVRDARVAFGSPQLQVVPTGAGCHGVIWVQMDRFRDTSDSVATSGSGDHGFIRQLLGI